MPSQVKRWLFPAALAAALFAGSAAFADDSGGITVTGTGIVKAHPTVAEIAATVFGDGELAADANVKYTDTKKKAIAALNAMKIPNLTIESDGPSVSEAVDAAAQLRAMQGMAGATTGKQRVQVSEQVRLVLNDADKLPADNLVQTVLKMVDTCHDAGLQIGPPASANYYQMQIRAQMGTPDTMVTFKISDIWPLESQAYQKAVEDAKTKAQRIADLAGVKLGRVISVQDQGLAGGANQQESIQAVLVGAALGGGNSAASRQLSSASLSDIPVTVHVTVKYEIAK